jgi:L,D-transpeptidase catalytic domain/Putative peptidoglycan binding domain
MRRSRIAPLAALALAVHVAPAWAAGAPGEAQPPASPPSTTPSTPPVAPAPVAPAAGAVSIALQRARGRPPLAMVGHRVAFNGSVTPFVEGQKVKVSIYRDAKKLEVRELAVLPAEAGRGRFHFSLESSSAGVIKVRAVHYATPQQVHFAGAAPAVSYVHTNLGPGMSGMSVRVLQSELNALHYAVPLSGVFDEGTANALIAYRKMVGIERTTYAGRGVFERLARGQGSFHVRYRGDGRHVEADLTRQVLAEVAPRGRVVRMYTMSSGKPSTPTVIGRFRVYMKTWGTNSEGMVDSNYFVRGYAIHGYAEVPTYAASHGCLRIPIPDAAAVYAWVHEGTPVDVYNEYGGGLTHVRRNAGP